MSAALCLDDFPQLGHYLIVRSRGPLVVKRGLNFRPKPAIVYLGFFNRDELGSNWRHVVTRGLVILRQYGSTRVLTSLGLTDITQRPRCSAHSASVYGADPPAAGYRVKIGRKCSRRFHDETPLPFLTLPAFKVLPGSPY